MGRINHVEIAEYREYFFFLFFWALLAHATKAWKQQEIKIGYDHERVHQGDSLCGCQVQCKQWDLIIRILNTTSPCSGCTMTSLMTVHSLTQMQVGVRRMRMQHGSPLSSCNCMMILWRWSGKWHPDVYVIICLYHVDKLSRRPKLGLWQRNCMMILWRWLEWFPVIRCPGQGVHAHQCLDAFEMLPV